MSPAVSRGTSCWAIASGRRMRCRGMPATTTGAGLPSSRRPHCSPGPHVGKVHDAPALGERRVECGLHPGQLTRQRSSRTAEWRRVAPAVQAGRGWRALEPCRLLGER